MKRGEAVEYAYKFGLHPTSWVRTLWKRELCIFAAGFIVLGAVALLPRGELSAQAFSSSSFLGFENYLRLLLCDPLFPRMVWNTLWPSLAAGVAALAVLLAVKRALRSRFSKMTAGWWDLLVYGLVFVSSAAPQILLVVMLPPALEEAAGIVLPHMESSWFWIRSCIKAAWLAWSVTWLLWGIVMALSAILYRKRAKKHG